MSGGAWGYQSYHIIESADQTAAFLKAVGESERIVDYAVSGDSNPSQAGNELYELWLATFSKVYADD